MDSTELETAARGAAHLAHYGKKGMKWGVITNADGTKTISDPSKLTSKTEVQISQNPGGYSKTKGGKNLPISSDALEALEGRQKAKASTTDSLSNVELKKVVDRMRLEQQYAELAYTSDRRSKGQKFVSGFFKAKRYNTGEKRKFADSNEEAGEKVRTAIETAQKARAAAKS